MTDKSFSEKAFHCANCVEKEDLGFDFTMAFQPIVDCGSESIYGYEALVRGLNNESAYSVISLVNDDNRYQFDQLCRVKAIALAAKLKLDKKLSINFLPKAVYQPERCIRTTLAAAETHQFPVENIMFEFTEAEQVDDIEHIRRVVQYYKSLGFQTAIDDFGAGYSGLGLLADFQTNVIKLDMALIRDIHIDPVRQAIVRNCVNLFNELGIKALAEGIETIDEYLWLKNIGIKYQQGFLFAKPAFEALPEANFPR